MIVFDEKIVGVWYLETIPGYQNWMAAVRELEPERKYEVTYRFRYQEDDKVFDSKDRKSWYRAETSQTRAFVVAGIRNAARKLEEVSKGGKLYELMNDGDFGKFQREFQDLPFVFVRQEKKVPE
ncbi:MAG TPA: hypothetical protein VK638_19660 [Edaphobacter sp.]|nr:hypothetical protein [Edaphobacter sp.]